MTILRRPNRPSRMKDVQVFYARKRRVARSEATAGTHGGLREQTAVLGVKMSIILQVGTP